MPQPLLSEPIRKPQAALWLQDHQPQCRAWQQQLAGRCQWWMRQQNAVCSFTATSILSCPADRQDEPGFDSEPSRYEPKDTKEADMRSNKEPSSPSHFSGHNHILADVQINITSDTSITGLKIHSFYCLQFFLSQKNIRCTGIGQLLGNVGNSHAVHKH